MAFLMVYDRNLTDFVWQTFSYPALSNRYNLEFTTFGKFVFVLTVVLCFMPWAVSLEKMIRKYEKRPLRLSILAFAWATFCCFNLSTWAASHSYDIGISLKIVPVILLLLVFLVRAKVRAIKDIQHMSDT